MLRTKRLKKNQQYISDVKFECLAKLRPFNTIDQTSLTFLLFWKEFSFGCFLVCRRQNEPRQTAASRAYKYSSNVEPLFRLDWREVRKF